MRFFFALLLAGAAFAQPPSIQWTRQFGTSPATEEVRSAAATSPTGDVYVAGYTFGALPGFVNAGNYDAFLRKYDANGNELWTRQFGTIKNDIALGVAANSTGVYVVGWTGGAFTGQTNAGDADAFIRKYDDLGNELWTRQFGTVAVEEGNGVGVNAGGVFIVGSTNGIFSGQATAGSTDTFVRMYGHDGTELWTSQFGSPGQDLPAPAVGLDASGLYVAGYTSFGALPGQMSAGQADAFVRKYDFSGNALWTRQFGTIGSDHAFGVAADSTGVVAAGYTTGVFPSQPSASTDAFVRKYDSSGNELWTRQFGTSAFDQALAATTDGFGNVYIAGYTTGTFPGLPSGYSFVRKYDAGGTAQWTLPFGASGSNNVPWAAAAHATGVYVAGRAPNSAGDPDAVVLKIVDASNQPPAISVAAASVSVNEGATATNGGTYSDANAGDNVVISASFGSLSKSGTNSGTWSWSWNAADGPVPAQNVIVTADDGHGGVTTVSFSVAVVNVAPAVSFSVTPALNEGQSATLAGAITDPGTLDSHAVTINWGDGVTSTLALPAGVLTFSATHMYADDSPSGTPSDNYTIAVGVTDKDGGAGGASASLTVTNLAPSIGAITGPNGPLPIGSLVSLSAPVSDAGAQDALQCKFLWDDGSADTIVASSSGSCAATHTYATAGVYTVNVSVTDDDTGSASGSFEYVVIYDSSSGFVTGGGWILSPAGAYAANPALSGKASFGFVSRYQNGASTPSGQTEFQFQVAGFRFTSTWYQWLVVSGARAQYKGDGSVNGVSGYGFLLTAIDGQVNGGGDVDRFRIKIWKKATETTGEILVYDNVAGASDDLDQASPQALGGGSITIHKN
ncbi:MAG: PKD domain-containing protein [Acidobacteria bacterium]|nr:PKD domain-containing protein [Acidobacteriota bacterium]